MIPSWVLLILGVVLAQDQQPSNSDVILSSESENNYDGTYNYRYQTSNGISVEEEGSLKNPGTEGEAQTARGSYSYTAPDGQVITVNWYADETGFHAERTNIQRPVLRPTDIQRPEPRPSDIQRPVSKPTDIQRPTSRPTDITIPNITVISAPEFFRG